MGSVTETDPVEIEASFDEALLLRVRRTRAFQGSADAARLSSELLAMLSNSGSQLCGTSQGELDCLCVSEESISSHVSGVQLSAGDCQVTPRETKPCLEHVKKSPKRGGA